MRLKHRIYVFVQQAPDPVPVDEYWLLDATSKAGYGNGDFALAEDN